MEIKESLIDIYMNNDYENNYKENKSKNELLTKLIEKITKINSYIGKFIKNKLENIIMKDKLSLSKEEENFHNLFLLIKQTIETTFNQNCSMINKILNLLNALKEHFKLYFKQYDEFKNYQKKFEIKLNEIEDLKNIFISSAKKAESCTYEFIKRKVYNKKSKNQNEYQEKEDLKTLAKINLDKYKSILDEGNIDLKTFNAKQIELFKKEKTLEIQYKSIYSDCLMEYLEHQLLLTGSEKEIKDQIIDLNEENNKTKYKNYLHNYTQKNEIDFVQYKTHLDFENCQDTLELSTCFMAYNELAHCIGKYREDGFFDEAQKLEINKEINRILHLDEKITDEDFEKLIKFVDNKTGQNCFINLLSLLRATGIYEKSKRFIIIIGKVLNAILEYSEKEKNYEIAKNCLILSQTFYYFDLNNKKIYIFNLIKENKWIKGPQFWRPFIDIKLKEEFEKARNYKKTNLNDILLTQLLPYINNMRELDLDIRIIIKLVDEFLERYNYLDEESYNTVFTVISTDIKEIKKYRKEYKENPNLEKELYNYDDKNNNIKEKNNEINIEKKEQEKNTILETDKNKEIKEQENNKIEEKKINKEEKRQEINLNENEK